MAAYVSKPIDVEAANGTGDVLPIDGFDGKYIEVTGTFVATLGFEVSFDGGSNWREIRSLTGPDGFFVPHPATDLRVVTSGYSSGTPVAVLRATQ